MNIEYVVTRPRAVGEARRRYSSLKIVVPWQDQSLQLFAIHAL